ncbi:MAG: 16S rRNA (guanine(527)-N(7))-methyltransferase RsmG [Candidatus Margulisbacteria bacterium]|nr:16S rRNA (guanine(527)-N(7))-methyltransferase RsmG [Candidatus Margulisiibacteriota bacterium]
MNTYFKATLKSWGVELSLAQEVKFKKYLQLLQTASKKINLTKITKSEDIIEKHFLDSLAILKMLPAEYFQGKIKVIDLGSGAGFPGVPIKIIFPKIELALVDSVRKKVFFLEELVKEIELEDTRCIAERAEILGKDPSMRNTYDLALARAVSKTSVLTEYLLPFLKMGGQAVLYKGINPEEEIMQAKKAIDILGGELIKIEKFNIRENKRSLILIKKDRITPDQYPRKSGKPEKDPL